MKAQWTTNGNNIYNSNSDNVGIGTSNPQYRLHLLDNVSGLPGIMLDGQNGMTAGLWMRNTSANGKSYSLYSNSAGSLVLGDENNYKARLILDANGDIGIHKNLSVGYLETGVTADIHLNGLLYSQ
ncbi:MAG: hypothetical protein GXC73_19280, partial [Chitinophagaceae bacterium]|nr:hypothetical protein [Chitinophagaceae bacterium]